MNINTINATNPLNGLCPLDIVVPAVDLKQTESGTLTWGEVVIDTVKVTKGCCDPVSDCIAEVAGCLCCVAVICAQADENDRRATRHDVVYADNIRRRQADERGAVYECGHFIGDATVDSSAMVLGGLLGVIRATCLSIFNKRPKREEPVLGVSRQEIDKIDVFDSCACCSDCC